MVFLSFVGSVAGLLVAPAAGAAGDARPAPDAKKIAAELAADFEESDSQEFWVKLSARADLSAARQIDDWGARGTEVARTLQAFADETQAPVRELLDERGADYSPYWIVNAIRVHGGSAALALEISALPGVGSIFGPVAYESPEPIEGTARSSSSPGARPASTRHVV